MSGRILKNRDQQAAAPEVMKTVLFGNGQLGWHKTDTPQANLGFDNRQTTLLSGPVYYREVRFKDYSDMRAIPGCFTNGTKAIAEALGIDAAEIRLGNVGSGNDMQGRVEITADAFEAKILPKLGMASAGDVGSNLVIADFGGKAAGPP